MITFSTTGDFFKIEGIDAKTFYGKRDEFNLTFKKVNSNPSFLTFCISSQETNFKFDFTNKEIGYSYKEIFEAFKYICDNIYTSIDITPHENVIDDVISIGDFFLVNSEVSGVGNVPILLGKKSKFVLEERLKEIELHSVNGTIDIDFSSDFLPKLNSVIHSGVSTTTAQDITDITDAIDAYDMSKTYNFIDLTDTPNDLTSLADSILKVNGTGTAIEAIALASQMISYDNSSASIPGVNTNVKEALDNLKGLIDAQPQQIVVADITERDVITTPIANSIVHVIDASADTNVTTGWAKYQYINNVWEEYITQEDINIVALTDLQALSDTDTITGTVSGKQISDNVISKLDDYKSTDGDIQTGSVDDKYVTPKQVNDFIDIFELTDAETLSPTDTKSGTISGKQITDNVISNIDSYKSTDGDIQTGSVDDKYVTPKQVNEYMVVIGEEVLRKLPIADITALISISHPSDATHQTVLDDGTGNRTEFIFHLGKTPTVDDFIDNTNTGAWVKKITVIDDLTTGGTTNALSAEQGKLLQDTKENKIDSAVFQSVGSENSLGINQNDDTLQKLALKLDSYNSEGGIDPWLPNTVYTSDDLFTFSTTNSTAVDINGNDIVANETYIGKYPIGATSNATITNAEIMLIEVVSNDQGSKFSLYAILSQFSKINNAPDPELVNWRGFYTVKLSDTSISGMSSYRMVKTFTTTNKRTIELSLLRDRIDNGNTVGFKMLNGANYHEVILNSFDATYTESIVGTFTTPEVKITDLAESIHVKLTYEAGTYLGFEITPASGASSDTHDLYMTHINLDVIESGGELYGTIDLQQGDDVEFLTDDIWNGKPVYGRSFNRSMTDTMTLLAAGLADELIDAKGWIVSQSDGRRKTVPSSYLSYNYAFTQTPSGLIQFEVTRNSDAVGTAGISQPGRFTIFYTKN